MKKELDSYQTADVLGKSLPELIMTIYDGAINHLGRAAANYRDNNLTGGYDSMEQARKFIVHLYATLDKEKGGDVAENLGKLYAFVIEQINLVQATKDVAAIESSINILRNVREGWKMLADEVRKKPSSVNDQSALDITPPTGRVSVSV
ncbi:putative Flagellar protein FliS [Candidatus Zixiibacteriota bacterium]|nr:putative Flagellar protein FliS [candidate division Zixibacteria bacterium]